MQQNAYPTFPPKLSRACRLHGHMVIILIYLLAQHTVKHSVMDTRNDADAADVVATATAAVADVVADEWLLTYAVEALSYVVYLVLTSAPVSG